jgi:hypothetical protein
MGVDHTTLGPSCGAVFPRAAPCLRALTPTGAPLKLQDLILAEGSNAVCHSSAFVRTHFRKSTKSPSSLWNEVRLFLRTLPRRLGAGFRDHLWVPSATLEFSALGAGRI